MEDRPDKHSCKLCRIGGIIILYSLIMYTDIHNRKEESYELSRM